MHLCNFGNFKIKKSMTDVIYGRNTVMEAFSSGMDIEKVFVLSTLKGEFEVQIRNICRDQNIPMAKVPEVKLNELTKYKAVHQGVVATISPIKYIDYKEIIAEVTSNGQKPLIVVMDGVTDVRNIGAVARSAYFFGAHALIISGNFAGRISEDTVKTSAGAIMKIPVCRVSSLLHLVSELQAMGIIVIASSLKDAVEPHDCEFSEPVALVLGSEDKGLHYKVLEVVDQVVKIPAYNDFDSLNVSVAGGILLYEAMRQRMNN